MKARLIAAILIGLAIWQIVLLCQQKNSAKQIHAKAALKEQASRGMKSPQVFSEASPLLTFTSSQDPAKFAAMGLDPDLGQLLGRGGFQISDTASPDLPDNFLEILKLTPQQVAQINVLRRKRSDAIKEADRKSAHWVRDANGKSAVIFEPASEVVDAGTRELLEALPQIVSPDLEGILNPLFQQESQGAAGRQQRRLTYEIFPEPVAGELAPDVGAIRLEGRDVAGFGKWEILRGSGFTANPTLNDWYVDRYLSLVPKEGGFAR